MAADTVEERRNARRASEAKRSSKTRGATLASGRNSPTRRIDDGGRRKEAGKNRGAKGIPQSALWGSVNATLKSAYKSLRRRFPSARRVPIGLKLVRLTAFVPSLFFFVVFVLPLSRFFVLFTLLLGTERDFSAIVAFSTTANRFNCREYCRSRYCNDHQNSFADLRRDVRR